MGIVQLGVLFFNSAQTSTVSPKCRVLFPSMVLASPRLAGTLKEEKRFIRIPLSMATPAILPGVLQSPCSSTTTAKKKKNKMTPQLARTNSTQRNGAAFGVFCVASSIKMPLKSKPLGRVPVVQWCLTASFLFASSPSISPQGRLTLSMTELFFIPRQSGSSSATIISRSSTQQTRGSVSQVLLNYGKDRKGDN